MRHTSSPNSSDTNSCDRSLGSDENMFMLIVQNVPTEFEVKGADAQENVEGEREREREINLGL